MPPQGQLPAHTILASQPGEWNGWADALAQTPKYVEPFGHLECYLALENDVAYLDNYEATTDHFPIRYKTDIYQQIIWWGGGRNTTNPKI